MSVPIPLPPGERGTPLSTGEARLVAGQIRDSKHTDPQYWPWVIETLCDGYEALAAEAEKLAAENVRLKSEAKGEP